MRRQAEDVASTASTLIQDVLDNKDKREVALTEVKDILDCAKPEQISEIMDLSKQICTGIEVGKSYGVIISAMFVGLLTMYAIGKIRTEEAEGGDTRH